MAQPTTQLLSIVQKHLDLPQDDENVVLIAKFLVNLHGNSTLEEFKKVVKENGGDEFEDEFIKEVYNEISPPPPQVGKIYSGVVQSVTNYGAFIKIEGTSGLCHISQMSFDGSRVESTNVLAPNQKVFVKVINIQTHANRISLSMRGINQNT